MFTDKTGTLTENNMEFIECCVDGHVYVADAICNGQVMNDLMDGWMLSGEKTLRLQVVSTNKHSFFLVFNQIS